MSKQTLNVGGESFSCYPLSSVASAQQLARLPFSLKILLENLLRFEDGVSVTRADIEALAQAAVERLPDLFRQHLANVILRVQDFPDADVIDAMALESEWDILGLYWGHPVGNPGGDYTGALPPTIFLYRRPILDYWCESGEDLPHIVRHVLIHEIGHHFGLSDDDMEAIEAKAEEDSQRA